MAAEPKPFPFGAKLKELEAITAQLDQGEVDLDDGLAKFERGMELVAELRKYLGEATNRVEQIKQKYALTESEPPEDSL